MILVGNQRGGAKNLALHLMKDENDHVELHELRGFASHDIMGALNEAYAVSRGTRCKQFLFSLSLNPPKEAKVTTEEFEQAISKVEDRLGLTKQARAIVFHEKEGRRHAHAVWSRIDIEEMKAVQLSYSKNRMQEIARELFIEHGWKMPHGLTNSKQRHPKNFTLAEWQQAKRAEKDPRQIKTTFEDAWAISDNKASFTHAMQERGYTIARGDRKGRIVAVDVHGEVYSISRQANVKIKQVRERLGDEQTLPSVDEAKHQIAENMLPTLERYKQTLNAQDKRQQDQYKQKRDVLIVEQRAERQAFIEQQNQRSQREAIRRQSHFRAGLKGMWDFIRGENNRIKKENEADAKRCAERDRIEKDQFIFNQINQRRMTQQQNLNRKHQFIEQRRELQQDSKAYEKMKALSYEDRKQAFKKGRLNQKLKQQNLNPDIER